jgi:hypothetical protein
VPLQAQIIRGGGQEHLSEDRLDTMTLPVLDVELLFAVTAVPSRFDYFGRLGRNEFRLNGTYQRLGLIQAETDIALPIRGVRR